MRRMLPGHAGALVIAVILTAMAATLVLPSVGIAADRLTKKPKLKINETVNDLAYVVSSGEVVVEGVGLVTGLDGTGGDAPPSYYRKQLIDEMAKAGVPHAEKLLADPHLSIVIVRMVIPMGVNSKDPIDAQVEVPPGCPTKSLAGGYLISARLFAIGMSGKGDALRDHELGVASGPIMVGTPARPDDLKVGRVLGGGRVKRDYHYTLAIRESRESFHTAKLLEEVINARFHQMENGHQKGMATGKNARFLVLKVPELYHQNQARYFQVVQALPVIDRPELRARRLADWGKELLDPSTAGVAALKLEALGNGSIEALKEGLKSGDDQVRFFAAEALAYLNETAGVETLGETAIKRTEFRAYALAALAALDQSASHMKLRQLMDQPDIELRYGAFNALRTLDPTDAFLGRVPVLDIPRSDEDDEPAADGMAIEIASSYRRRHRPEDPFALYLVDSDGPPLVHVSRTRRTEIVVFGSHQKLRPPIVLDGGDILINAGDNAEMIELSKIVPSQGPDSDVKVASSMELAEVIRRVANLGATYPQIVALLEKASKQLNLPGKLVVDAVPVASPAYLEAIAGKDWRAKKDDEVDRASDGSGRPRWRLFQGLGLFRRDHDANPAPAPAASNPAAAMAATRNPEEPGVAGSDLPPLPGDPESPSAKAPAGGRRDEAVRQTSASVPSGGSTTPAAERPSPPRRRLLDFLRRDGD